MGLVPALAFPALATPNLTAFCSNAAHELTCLIATPNLPPLNEAQAEKLHLLTLLTQCSSHATLTYSSLLSALSLPTSRDLEGLVTRAIYAGLLSAELNPLHARVDVASVSPLRDLAPNSVSSMINMLEEWEQRCAEVETDIQERLVRIKEVARERTVQRRIEEQMRDKAAKAVASEKLGGEGVEGRKRVVYEDMDGDRMDVDGGYGGGRGGHRGAKRRGHLAASRR